MIQISSPQWQSTNWKKVLASAIREPKELLQRLDLPPTLLANAEKASTLFPLRAPLGFVSRMKRGDLNDPLLLQLLPLHLEFNSHPDYSSDPVGDLAATQSPGLLHKYHGRVLLITTGACAIHCRYCFRRHFPYANQNPSTKQWYETINYIKNNTDITEVILSGGDPLTLSDEKITKLVNDIEAIEHIDTIRIHTRLPIMVPERITFDLCQLLAQSRLQTVVVIHANHANEIDESVVASLKLLSEANVTLLNQAVLLRKINDSGEDQVNLAKTLFKASVLPYYLHMLDKVQGAAHFAIDDAEAMQIMQQLRTTLPGYLVPKLVREIEGAESKQPVSNS